MEQSGCGYKTRVPMGTRHSPGLPHRCRLPCINLRIAHSIVEIGMVSTPLTLQNPDGSFSSTASFRDD